MTNHTPDMYHDHDGPYWSGNPNQALITETSFLNPTATATALDIGAGEGADAIYLATRGYHVTALEPSPIASDRIANAIPNPEIRQKITIRTEPFETAHLDTYDLVTACYTPLRDTKETLTRLLNTITPGGHLIMVHHDDITHMARHENADVTDFLTPDRLHHIITTYYQNDYILISHSTSARHITHGMGAGHTTDQILHLVRLDPPRH